MRNRLTWMAVVAVAVIAGTAKWATSSCGRPKAIPAATNTTKLPDHAYTCNLETHEWDPIDVTCDQIETIPAHYVPNCDPIVPDASWCCGPNVYRNKHVRWWTSTEYSGYCNVAMSMAPCDIQHDQDYLFLAGSCLCCLQDVCLEGAIVVDPSESQLTHDNP